MGGLPLGWMEIEATASTSFKTAGSSANIIENKVGADSRVHTFIVGTGVSGGGAGVGAFDAIDTLANLEALARSLGKEYFDTDSKDILSDDGVKLNKAYRDLGEVLEQGQQSFVKEVLLTAVDGAPGATEFRSDIVGRASIPDDANMLKPVLGSEGLKIDSISSTPFNPIDEDLNIFFN